MTGHDGMMDWGEQIGNIFISGEKSAGGLYCIGLQSLHIMDY